MQQLGAELARDYAGREPVLVGSLKACVPFVTDLSRAIPIAHALDFVELAGYGTAEMGGHEQIRFIKDLDLEISGRDVVIVDEVVDTGLTLHYLCRALVAPRRRSRSCARRSSTGPTAGSSTTCRSATSASPFPDEFFAGYGFDLDERWRNLPDLHLVV